MIWQICFLKGVCGWVNFPDCAIKLGVVNEVINVLSCQAEGYRDGTRTFPGEKDPSCPFVIMQQVSKQRSTISAPGIPIHCWKTRSPTRMSTLLRRKWSIFVISWGVKRSSFFFWYWSSGLGDFCLYLYTSCQGPQNFLLPNLGMRSFNSVCGKFV